MKEKNYETNIDYLLDVLKDAESDTIDKVFDVIDEVEGDIRHEFSKLLAIQNGIDYLKKKKEKDKKKYAKISVNG